MDKLCFFFGRQSLGYWRDTAVQTSLTLNSGRKFHSILETSFLSKAAQSILLALFTFLILPSQLQANTSNPIILENLKAGSDQWSLTQEADDITQQIKGFASATSVNLGETINFHISVSPAQSYTIDLYRMGWYDGKGARLVTQIGPLNGIQQPALIYDQNTGMITAPWSVSYALSIPTDWTSGIYLAKLINAEGYDNYIIFVVRDDNRAADLLYQQSVTTYQAYNNYPEDGLTGKNFYSTQSYGGNTMTGEKRAVKVSFDRPYRAHGAGQFFSWEVYLVRWLERSGYNVAYSTNIDTHANGGQLLNYKGFLSTGHDEYWTTAMYDATELARNSGVNLAFFGSNAVYWRTRLETSANGTPNRVVATYKDPTLDPETVRWRELGRAEQALIGIQYGAFAPSTLGNTDYIIKNSSHWVYENAGVVENDLALDIVGYEADYLHHEYPMPPHQSHTILSESPFVGDTGPIIANSSIYQAYSGAWVFAAGTMSWSWALDKSGYFNAGVRRATANILNRFVGVTVETPGCSNQRRVEAEEGTLYGGFEILPDSAASGQMAVAVPNGFGSLYDLNPSNRVDYCFIVDREGEYQIKGQFLTTNEGDNSFFMQVDGLPVDGKSWHVPLDPNYHEAYAPWQGILSPGEHTISIFLREDGGRLDWIELEPVFEEPLCHSGLVAEMEDGVLFGNFVSYQDSAASGGQGVEVPLGTGNQVPLNPNERVDICLTVVEGGNYQMKAQVQTPSVASNSLYLQVDGAPNEGIYWDMPIHADYQNEITPWQGSLTPGEHTISFFLREHGTRLDKVELELLSVPDCSTGLVAEAEEGDLFGNFIVVQDSAASGGLAVEVPEGAGHRVPMDPTQRVDLCLTVETQGIYQLNAQIYAPDSSSDSLYLQVNDGPIGGSKWTFNSHPTYQTSISPWEGELAPGEHKISIFLREDGTRVDSVVLELVE